MANQPKLKTTTAFQEAYKKLNDQQRKAVDTIEGPVMVVAGPGTGKTQVLATRIANILLKTDTPPWAILALTFTDSAAKNMRERLVQLIGPTAYSINVQTFHAFCDDVIRSHPEYFPMRRESEVLSDLERYDLLEELLNNPQLTALRTINSPYHYVNGIIKAISDLKREGVNEVRFAELVKAEEEALENERAELKKTELIKREKNCAKMSELALIYTQYQQQLRARSRYDYDDMIAFVAEAFQNEETLLLEYQERLTYFLVDEYQDTNAAQNQVVDLLASFWGEQANIFVVGDPHQSIYRFQGASLENTLNFVGRYPTATVVTLEVGYRCPQTVYEAAAAVIQHNEVESDVEKKLAVLDKPLKSIHGDGEKIGIYTAASPQLETIFVAEKIKRLMEEGVSPRDIAVLYKKNAEVLDFQLAFEKWDIPYCVDGGNDVLLQEHIHQFLLLCKTIFTVRTSQEGRELFEVMNFPWLGLDRSVVMKVTRAAGKTRMSLYDRIMKGYVDFCKIENCEEVTAMDFEVLVSFIGQLVKWGQQDAEFTFPQWFELVMDESKFLEWILAQPEKTALLHHLNALFREVRALATQDPGLNLERFLQSLQTMQEHGISIMAEEFTTGEETVTLSTVHKAKGQEWAHVFLTGCIDGQWGNTRKLSSLPLPAGILRQEVNEERDRNEDDRRLFYVALTRAMQSVTITYPDTVISGSQSKVTLPSMFIEEIPEVVKQKIVAPEIQENADTSLAMLLQVAPHKDYTEKEKAWFRGVIENYKLSFTDLNRYLESPQKFIEETLLKVPKLKEEPLVFGTAMHSALEYLFKEVQTKNVPPDLKNVLSVFKEALARETLTQDRFNIRLKQGQDVLTKYYEEYAHQENAIYAIEKFFGGGWSKTYLDDIPLQGKIDRMDIVDPQRKTLCVIDYKTGHAKTINEIEGKVSIQDYSERELALPENIRGRLKRQLLFYKLLTELDPTFKATVEQGTFDFVEPDERGKFTRRTFTLLDEDVEALKDLIRQVMKEIRELKFLE